MSGALEIAAIGLRAQQRALDAIAGNISNVNTPSYKRANLRFAELVSAAPTTGEQSAARPENLSVNGVRGWISTEIGRQGKLDSTGNSLDLAIDGAGFIELMGPAGRSLLWRGGTLRVLEDGQLATASGIQLKAGITAPRDVSSLRIDRDGTVFAGFANNRNDEGIGTISLVKVDDAVALDRLDGGIYDAGTDAALGEAAAGEDGLGYLVQGSLERSNVDLNEEMVGLLVTQRAYAANAQVIRAADELLGLANNLRK
jgi:flagellar basal-body rod protein FlgG